MASTIVGRCHNNTVGVGFFRSFVYGPVDLVVFCAVLREIVFLHCGGIRTFDLNQSGLRAVDDHGSHGLDFQIPVMRNTFRFGHGIFMTFSKEMNRSCRFVHRHLADGNESGFFPTGCFAHGNSINDSAVTCYVHGDRLGQASVQGIRPHLFDRH